MANRLYPKGAEKILSGSVNLTSDTIKVALLSDAYTYSTAHEFVSDLGTRIGTDQTLTGKSVTGGVFDATDLDFGSLPPGDTVKAVVIYKDTGNASTSPVLAHLDSGASVGLPFATNGGGVTLPWNNDAKKIFRLNLPIYPKGGEKMFSGAINFATDAIKAVSLPSSYTYNAAHEFLADVGTVIGTAVALAGKSVTGGAFDANDTDLGALAAGSTLGSILLFKDTGSAASSPVLARLTDITGFPLSTSGTNVSVRWSDGSTKIFSLTPA